MNLKRKLLVCGLALILGGISAIGTWLSPSPNTTLSSNDHWWFRGNVYVTSIEVGGTTGTNGTFVLNGVSYTDFSTVTNTTGIDGLPITGTIADGLILKAVGTTGIVWSADSGSGAGAFSDTADPIVQNTTTKDVHIGDGAGTLVGKMEIGGDADQPQLVIEGFSTQTDDILIVQNDADTEVFSVSVAGAVTAASVVTGTGFTIGAAAITEAELEILDGATITTAETDTLSDGSNADALHVHASAGLSGIVNADLSGSAGITGANILNDTVVLATDTAGNYAAGNAEAGAALSGDSATAFFATGTIEHERGGLELNISTIGVGDVLAGASAGVIEIVDGGAASDGDVLTIQVDGTANFETPAAGSGDSITVGGTNIDTTAEFTNTGNVAFSVADGGTNGPDDISASVTAAVTLDAEWDTEAELETAWGSSNILLQAEGDALYQPLEATLTDIADGTIAENLVNTAFPWADNEVTNALTVDDAGIASTITRDTEWNINASITNATITVNPASGLDTYTAGTLFIGPTVATKVEVAGPGIITQIQGSLDVDQEANFDGAITALNTFTVDGLLTVSNVTINGLITATSATLSISNVLTQIIGNNSGILLVSTNINMQGNYFTNAIIDAADVTVGLLIHENGGLEANVSAYSGLVGIAGGSTLDVNTEAELETAIGGADIVFVSAGDISSANLITILSDKTGSGLAVFGIGPTISNLTLTGATTASNTLTVIEAGIIGGGLTVTGNVTVTGTVNGKDIADDAAMLNEPETISSNWVNTAFPWANDEVADDITASLYLPLTGGSVAYLSRTATNTANERPLVWIERASGTLYWDTIAAAKAVAVVGDTIVVSPGVHIAADILKNDVDYYFMPGATITNNAAIFVDGGAAITSTVSGAGSFITTVSQMTLTGASQLDIEGHLFQTTAGNELVTMTTYPGRLSLRADKIDVLNYVLGNTGTSTGTNYVHADEILCGQGFMEYGPSVVSIECRLLTTGTEAFFISQSEQIYVHIEHLVSGGNPIFEPTGSGSTLHGWIGLVEGNPDVSDLIYISGATFAFDLEIGRATGLNMVAFVSSTLHADSYLKIGHAEYDNNLLSFSGAYTQTKRLHLSGNYIGTGATGIDVTGTHVMNLLYLDGAVISNTAALAETSGSLTVYASTPTLHGTVAAGVTVRGNYINSSGNMINPGTLTIGAYTVPATDGTTNQVLKTDGGGTITWESGTNIAALGQLNIHSDVNSVSTPTVGHVLQYAAAGWTNAAAGAADNLGNHTATETLKLATFAISNAGPVYIVEQADASADVAGMGQIWVNTAEPNELWFTDDAGTDFQLGLSASGDAITVTNGAATDPDFNASGNVVPTLTGATGIAFNVSSAVTLDTEWDTEAELEAVWGSSNILLQAEGDALYQPLEATLTDIADGTIAENLVNTANPWAADEIVSTVILSTEIDASSKIAAIVADETGSGALVFSTAPNLTSAVAVTSFNIPNGTGPTTDAEGEIAYDTNADAFEVYDGTASRLLPLEQLAPPVHIAEPDSVATIHTNVVVLFVDDNIYPNGITVTGWSIATSATCTDTPTFAEYSNNGTAWARDATVDAVTLSGTETADTTITAPDLEAGDYLILELDAAPTDVAWWSVSVSYWVDPD